MATLTSALARFGRRVAEIFEECNYAQRRMFALRTSPDLYSADRNKAPDTYAEFLFRASNAPLHEPAASSRAHGRLIG